MAERRIVPIWDVVLPKGTQLDWQLMKVGGQVVGFESPRFGRFVHVAVVDETNKFLYDWMVKLDGPVQSDGHATPGAVMVVVEERPDGFYLHCQEEYRPVIYDHVNQQQGVVVIGFAGGYSKKGEKPSDTALREALEEQGIEVEIATVERLGYATDNRATTETCHEVYMAYFKRKGAPNPDENEMIGRTRVVRVDEFPIGQDGIVNSAYAMLVRRLGLVRPK